MFLTSSLHFNFFTCAREALLSRNKEISLANQCFSYVFCTERPEKVELGSTFSGTEQNRKFSDHV